MDDDQIKKSVTATFDDVSARYDQNRFFSISAERMAELVPVSETMSVLDISTGTGAVASAVARKHAHAKIDAVDLSLGMLEQAKRKAKQEGLENIEFSQCDVESLPHEDGAFDVVTCGYGIFFYPNMEATYQSVCKKIKPGGVFIFSTFTPDAFNPYAKLFFNRIGQEYGVEIPGRLLERLDSKEKIEALASLSDPKEIAVETIHIRYPMTVSDWWSLLNNAGYKSLIAQLSSEQLAQFKQEQMEEIEDLAVDGAIELNADSLFGVVRV